VTSRARFSFAAAACALLLLAAGCGSGGDESAPSACRGGAAVYLDALQSAPGEVRLDGETPISDCLVPSQEGGELADVGQSMIRAASRLNVEARGNLGGDAALQLGYLLGAVSKGADSIHADLARRLQAAAQFSETGTSLSGDFQRQFARGYAAGRQSG
jgi:hypothetical protein